MKKKFLAFMMSMAIVLPALLIANTAPVLAQPATDQFFNSSDFNDAISRGPLSKSRASNLEETLANAINIVIGFLGIIAVVIILIGGFTWMTSAGNEDKVGEAKKIITAGVIGLVIVLSAFAIANFALETILRVQEE